MPPGSAAGQAGATERSQTSTSRSTWIGPPAEPAISSASAIDIRHRPAAQLVAVDDRDAVVGGPGRVLGRVGEVGDADLHDPAAVEARLDEPAHRRAVADAVAQVVVGVDGDEARGAQPVAPGAESRGNGGRVVAAEGDQQCRVACRGGNRRRCPRLALCAVRVGAVAPVLGNERAAAGRAVSRAVFGQNSL